MPDDVGRGSTRLAGLFDRSKCENVVVHKEDCHGPGMPAGRRLPARQGLGVLLQSGQGGSRLLDPAWLGPAAVAAKRTNLRWLVLLRNDSTSPAIVDL